MHAQMLHEVIMPTKIFATARVWASMGYIRQKKKVVSICALT